MALFGLAACGDDGDETSAPADGDSASASTDPIKLGFIGPLSGAIAFIGQPSYEATKAWIEYVNEQGGIDGAEIELVAVDDTGDVAKASNAVRSLADEGAVAILGPQVSSQIEAAKEVAEREEVSLVVFGAAPSFLDPVPEWLFQTGLTSGSSSQAMSEFAGELAGDDARVALAPIDTPSGAEWGEAIQSTWGPENGLDVLGVTPLPLAAADMTVQAQQILRGNPDVVLTQSLDSSIVVLVEKLRELGYEGPIVNHAGGGSDAVLNQLEDPNLYVQRALYRADSSAAEGEPGYQYAQVMEGAGIAEPDVYADYGVTLALVAVGALQECGADCDAAGFNAALSDITIETDGVAFGPADFDSTDHQGLNVSGFYHWTDGGIEVALDGRTFEESAYTCC